MNRVAVEVPVGHVAPVAEDMSSYVLGGRVTDTSLGLDHAVAAERLGFRRVWISERHNLKEAGVLMAGIAARTTRLGVGTGAITASARPPNVTAAIGATIHAAFGPRCVIGLGAGQVGFNKAHGLPVMSSPALIDYAGIIKRLWRGETVDYDGPAGSYHGLRFTDTYDGPPPGLWHVQLGGPEAAKVAANRAFDGVLVTPFMTPEATRECVRRLRAECECLGRDPASLRMCQSVVTAPATDPSMPVTRESANPSYGSGLLDFDTLRCFAVITLAEPNMGAPIVRRNGWDESVRRSIRHHPLIKGRSPDLVARDRTKLMEVAELVPAHWIRDSCAIGSASECVSMLQQFRDAGADEVAVYGSTPAQNAEVIDLWRSRPQASATSRGPGI